MNSLFSRAFARLVSGGQLSADGSAKGREDRGLENKGLEDKSDKNRTGSVFSSAALIAGTTVGAGVLALPAVTLPVGLVPSMVLMVAAWLYMLISGLLIAEANLQAMRQTGRADLGLLATVRLSLGKRGAIAAGIIYIFIHYALLVAYVARGGDILTAAIANGGRSLGMLQPDMVRTVPLWWGHVAFVAILGGVLYGGSKRFVSGLNSVLVVMVVVAFGGLLGLTLEQVEVSRWQFQQWAAVSTAVPVMFVAFVYQNVVPVITTQLAGDEKKVRKAIVLGSLVPLAMFALWNAVILGSVEIDALALNNASAAGIVIDPIELLRQGKTHPLLGMMISVFSEVAIATSFIGFVLGLLNVFNDVFKSTFEHRFSQLNLVPENIFYGLTLIVPLLLSFIDPNIFFEAIDFAGAFGNSTLFGIVPVLMIWKMRGASASSVPLVPGGKGLLIAMMAIAVSVILQNAWLKASLFIDSF